MQLIFESETAICTEIIMSTLEKSLERKIAVNGVIGDLNKDACNGYRGSMHSEDISADEESISIENEKIEDEEILLKSPISIHNVKENAATDNPEQATQSIDKEETAKQNIAKHSFEENETLTNKQGDANTTTINDQVTRNLEVNKLQTSNTGTEKEVAIKQQATSYIAIKQHVEDEPMDKQDDSYLEKDELTLLKEELANILAEEKYKVFAQEVFVQKESKNINIDANNKKNDNIVSVKDDANKEKAHTKETYKESLSLNNTVTIESTNNATVAVAASIFNIESSNDKGRIGDNCSSSKITVCENIKNVHSKEMETTNLSIQPFNKEGSLDNDTCSKKTAKCKSTMKIDSAGAGMTTVNIQTTNNKKTLKDKISLNKNADCEDIREETKLIISNIKEHLDENNLNAIGSEDITKTFPTCIEMSTVHSQASDDKESVEDMNSSNKTISCKDNLEDNDVDTTDFNTYSINKDNIEKDSSTNKNIACIDTKNIIPTINDDIDMTTINIQPSNKKQSSDLNYASVKIADVTESIDAEILHSNNKESIPMNSSSNKVAEFVNKKETDVEMNIIEISNSKESIDVTSSPSKSGDCRNATDVADVEMTTVDIQTLNNNESVNSNRLLKTTDSDDVTEIIPNKVEQHTISIYSKEDFLNVDESKDVEEVKTKNVERKKSVEEKPVVKSSPVICKLSNTLDILSDDEEDSPKEIQDKIDTPSTDKHCINIDDDDDIMFIEDTNSGDSKKETKRTESANDQLDRLPKSDGKKIDLETGEEKLSCRESMDNIPGVTIDKDSREVDIEILEPDKQPQINENKADNVELKKPLLPINFLKSAKKNLADMTRDDLEEFCVLKIVESIVDRSNLSDIKTQLKHMALSIEEYRKKAMMLTKQNRDLQVVLKSIQEEQKKAPNAPITPLKITRSVGMQVLMTEKPVLRRKLPNGPQSVQTTNSIITRQMRNPTGTSPRVQKQAGNIQNIPVPRLVPANSPVMKPPTTPPVTNVGKASSPVANGPKNSSSGQKGAEKRQHNRVQSVTVDLTDDEPPAKINARNSPAPPVRLVPSQNLLAPQRQPFGQSANSPRKVYIPISGPQGQNIRPGHTIMLKSVPGSGPRQRCPPPQMPKIQHSQVRMNRIQGNRHPAPLPDAMKQYQPPTWKNLPPAPDLKLSKVENGIVISWKIEGYQEDSYEEIASYQLYAYQETSSPPNTALWKKIGDVKALPLPMACTLTQFMAGFKYYFAVRAVDIRSRLGPFSLPGSILLLNKM